MLPSNRRMVSAVTTFYTVLFYQPVVAVLKVVHMWRLIRNYTFEEDSTVYFKHFSCRFYWFINYFICFEHDVTCVILLEFQIYFNSLQNFININF